MKNLYSGHLSDISSLDINSLFKSVTNNLPQELTKNLPKEMSLDFLNNITDNIDLDEIKKMAGIKGNVRVNHSKLNQLTRLEKRRERLRKKLKERKELLQP